MVFAFCVFLSVIIGLAEEMGAFVICEYCDVIVHNHTWINLRPCGLLICIVV